MKGLAVLTSAVLTPVFFLIDGCSNDSFAFCSVSAFYCSTQVKSPDSRCPFVQHLRGTVA